MCAFYGREEWPRYIKAHGALKFGAPLCVHASGRLTGLVASVISPFSFSLSLSLFLSRA